MQLAQQILDNLKGLWKKWNKLNIYGAPYPEFPDYGVEEQELLLKKNMIDQLNMISEYVDCSELMEEIRDSLDESIKEYATKYGNDGDITRTFKIIGITCKTNEIYCYLRKNEDGKVIVFKDANYHDKPDDCFHVINYYGDYDDEIDLILSKLSNFSLNPYDETDTYIKCNYKSENKEALINAVKSLGAHVPDER